MTIKISDLTVAEFIDMICGEFENLRSPIQSLLSINKAMLLRDLIIEYRRIADPSSVKQYLSVIEDMVNARLEIILFSICTSLVDMDALDRAREVLAEYGISTRTMNDQRLIAEVKSRVERARSKLDELLNTEKDGATTSDGIRKQFDEQTAALMAHFKFQIDTSTMKANIYAHLVARYTREMKAQMAAAKRK